MNRLFMIALLVFGCLTEMQAQSQNSQFSSNEVTDEGAWCWFADPRAIHYENADGSINSTYIGYIDVHGNVKATQYDWKKQRKTDVLVRSYFQPDDHNNPTFIVLPDERVMIFYTRHTDEPKIWYRISTVPGDISRLGEEKSLSTANNTTYPSPFILSDDPDHIYLCWRGINWHPTIARLTMPDADGNCKFDFGPKQIVQSTGARPYAKYQSNGKDKIYLSYTTGHPDNEMPDWLYFNVIDINKGNGPVLRDIQGKQLSTISSGPFNVSKSDSYANSYPMTVVDKTADTRNWVWQISLDADEHPVIAYPHIDQAKTTHVYWYSRWTGTAWRNTRIANGGHAFHLNWNQTERCYSGGMAIDPDNVNDLYLSIPTKSGVFNKDGVYEIWKYTLDDEGKVVSSEQVTSGSEKNNIRPFVMPGSQNSQMRLTWMNGDYYYWMVNTNYPKGYPTGIRCDYEWKEPFTAEQSDDENPRTDCICLAPNKTLNIAFAMNHDKYYGPLFQIGDEKPLVYSLGTDGYPVVTIDGKEYKSQNRLYTSDDWATKSGGTNGDNHPTKLTTWVLSMTYDGHTLSLYRNGLLDQVIDVENLEGGTANAYGADFNHEIINESDFYACASPQTVKTMTDHMQENISAILDQKAIETINLPSSTRTDLVLPKTSLGKEVSWTSSDESVITSDGALMPLTEDKAVELTARVGNSTRSYTVTGLKRDITQNILYERKNVLDMTKNTANGFASNTYVTAPEGLLTGLRSYTFLLTVNAASLSHQPRAYDFGCNKENSVFLRLSPLAAGIKYNGGTTTMVSGATTLQTGKEYKLAVTYNASTHTTKIYIDGIEDVSGTANTNEAYMLVENAIDSRNYIGRTQWWDTSYNGDNVDFSGTISGFMLYSTCLTREEICGLQDIGYQPAELPSALLNGDFESGYSVQSGSGVSSDRAIYVPEGWTVSRSEPNNNDLTALQSGDLYFDRFFAVLDKPAEHGNHTYWIRQNWGVPTLTLSQELLLEEGEYELTADIWSSGSGGKAIVSAETEGGAVVSNSPAAENQQAWQPTSLTFSSDGKASTTIRLEAVHNSDGKEKIIGFDNVTLTLKSQPGLPGDVNEDGVINISDIVAIINHIAGTTLRANADVNEDGKVDISDIVAVINFMAQKQAESIRWIIDKDFTY